MYLSDVDRISFQRWSHGPTDLCIIFNEPGDFTAIHGAEVLLTINSEVREYRQSKWVPKSVPTLLSVPELVEERPGVRYLFEEWTLGESRFNPQNRIVPNRPLSLEVRWSKKYLLTLVGPADVRLVGQGWHKAGASVVIKAQDSSPEIETDTRFAFREWEVISNPAVVIPNKGSFETTIRMDNTHEIRANYHITFHVVVENPDGELLNVWRAQGESVALETPSILDREDEKERLSFNGWQGAEIEAPKGTIIIKEPIVVKALYDRQFKVNVEAKYGVTGDGWYTEGEIATISVPESPSTLFFLNRSFSGFDGYTTEGPVLQLPVTGAVTIAAAYKTTVDIRMLAIIIGALVAVGIVYLVTQREYNRRRRVVRW